MNDFDDVQQKAQEMTSSITSSSPAQPAPKVSKPDTSSEESFTYASYGEREEPKAKGPGGVTVVPNNQQFAVPYTGGGSYPGAVLYGAEKDPNSNVVT